ncbi:mitochondrial antiviral-signaling protein [Toxotes jaculatrix]|uniref:mitochondrial antiviral-signaling protein n=1 Tax=Toxotes jaculatrix TaxID=941984 RepID=UPI001B3A9D29|nr:mitochondrial antiviral-signaling protein [Toxotes jaculatrix]
MSFASDKLYNGYLRRKMPTIVSKVKVREIIIHLPCLTTHDRENIEAKRETCGNYDGMVLLLDCLKRRENWPEQFIEALEACEHSAIADEIRAEYNALRGVNNSNPSSPSATVIRAHVHPAPSASHLSVPESGGNTQAAVAHPAEPSAPPEPAVQASPPLETPVHPQAQSSAAHVPEAVSPPEPVPDPPQSTQIEVAPPPSTPPPSPETPHTPASTPPSPPQREFKTHQEPEENSESEIQDISVENGVTPDEAREGQNNVSVNSVATPPRSRPVEHCETDSLSQPDLPQTITTTTEVRPPQSPSPTQASSDVTDGSSLTPERPPVQDTAPPFDKIPVVVLEPEETSEPSTTQAVENRPQTETAASASLLPGAAGLDASLLDDNTLCLSKPGQLISIQPQNHDSPTIPAHNLPEEPYSGNSERLEISDAEPVSSGLSCQENGIAHNEPEENHYESPCQSLEMQVVRVNVVQVSEEPSILNLDGQISAPQAQIINGEAAREITPSSLITPSGESKHPSEPAPGLKTLPDSEEKTTSRTLPANSKYILTAAGVGAFALLMAWKFKN